MSCFWKGINNGLVHLQKKPNNGIAYQNKQAKDLSIYLKSLNKIRNDVTVTVQGHSITEKQRQENFESINTYDVEKYDKGYLCSTCDPFLILLCQNFKCNIDHHYTGILIKYRYCGEQKVDPKTIIFCSNKKHFWFKKIK